MNAITIDTHEFVKRLREAGLTEPQAESRRVAVLLRLLEAITDLQRKLGEATLAQAMHDFHQHDYATRHDIKELELKIEVLRTEVKKDMAEIKADLIRWVVGVGILQITIITALLLKLANHL